MSKTGKDWMPPCRRLLSGLRTPGPWLRQLSVRESARRRRGLNASVPEEERNNIRRSTRTPTMAARHHHTSSHRKKGSDATPMATSMLTPRTLSGCWIRTVTHSRKIPSQGMKKAPNPRSRTPHSADSTSTPKPMANPPCHMLVWTHPKVSPSIEHLGVHTPSTFGWNTLCSSRFQDGLAIELLLSFF